MNIKQIAQSKLPGPLHGEKIIIPGLQARLEISDVVEDVLQPILVAPVIAQDIVGEVAAVENLRAA